MTTFERYLSVWVLACIAGGILIGSVVPGVAQTLDAMSIANVNVPIGILIWVMIVPMLVRIDLSALRGVGTRWRGIVVTLVINWGIKPFLMAALAWLFVRVVFAGMLDAAEHSSYIAGLILLAAAPCTAMVFVWSRLVDGDAPFTLSQVALNDIIMIGAFAPIVGLLLGVSDIVVPWSTLLLSVGLYIVVPLILARLWRSLLRKRGPGALDDAVRRSAPWSTTALLATLVLLFAFQGERVLQQPWTIAILAVPIVVQVVVVSSLAYVLNRIVGESYSVAGPSCLIGASNFFELAVATAISTFGVTSGAALATVVGVLVEVPIMLLAVDVVRRSKRWYGSGSAVRKREAGTQGERNTAV